MSFFISLLNYYYYLFIFPTLYSHSEFQYLLHQFNLHAMLFNIFYSKWKSIFTLESIYFLINWSIDYHYINDAPHTV
jgi:hypothetical protein